ncbi:DUF3427 domain-containing protein [Amphibacillus sp. MSJ-3]|uniref:DUF3427 domain-containing protein n=1 Tax=Amphibacillus sp. MSJ-3 TaxID=2841505 RepID=UPI001C0EAE11|nr:DUF3427 domain-containing protein [Amphibacillus sp. MSJ-3]MBU5594557.1 DUF3427 domain-containing protein [Amphibacillus sp. MSJ-3]
MLRQTQSSIIFIQQLGRGLRKHESKEFVTIIDFIGNYKNNYMIPMALSGDKSQNKDKIRRYTKETSYIKGVSSINFEEIARKQIYQSINTNNLTSQKILRDAYLQLKNRLGRIPYLIDFIKNHSIDPIVIAGKHGNYYKWLLKMKEEIPVLNAFEESVLTMLSIELLNGKRKHELLLLKQLLDRDQVSQEEYIYLLKSERCQVDKRILQSVQRILDLSFFTKKDQEKYGGNAIVEQSQNGSYRFSTQVQERLMINPYFEKLFRDVMITGLARNKKYQPNTPFTRYEKYTRKDACKLLNWDNDESSTMYGYKAKHQTCPIFVTYHKGDEVESSVDYGDEFINQEVFKWYTRSKRTLASEEVKKIIRAEENGMAIHFFIKKDDDEGNDFYYLGEMLPDEKTISEDQMIDKNGKKIPVVHMNMLLDQPVEHGLYHYLMTSSN